MLDDESITAALKTPKLDSNALFEQLKASEETVVGIKDCFIFNPGQLGHIGPRTF
jgi:hypothetical protein